MQTLVYFATVLVCGAVVVVLGLGLWNMMKGGSGSRSQQLMRLRIILQALAIAVLLGALYLFGGMRGGA